MVEHRNVVNFFAGMDEHLGERRTGTWLAVTSISFDISVLELFWTLARGFKVVIQEELDKAAAERRRQRPRADRRPMDFSLFYFSADASERGGNRYRLLLEGAKLRGRHGFSGVWTPERHFHEFGGLYPNPAVTSAAVAAITSRVRVRAGSVVLPLHNPIRVAEEWAVVDNLSQGRVEMSFASGWHANDFALMPENYKDRRDVMLNGIDTVRRLWRGEAVPATSGIGATRSKCSVFPTPHQKRAAVLDRGGRQRRHLQDWPGRIGARLLTNLLGQKTEEVATKIAAYREAWREAGHPGEGMVALMLHTFVGADLDQVRDTVRAAADQLPEVIDRAGQAGALGVPGASPIAGKSQGAGRRSRADRGGPRRDDGARVRALLRDQRPVRHARHLPEADARAEGDRRRRDRLPDRLRHRHRHRAGQPAVSQRSARAQPAERGDAAATTPSRRRSSGIASRICRARRRWSARCSRTNADAPRSARIATLLVGGEPLPAALAPKTCCH